jgi:hypothetical protein
VPLNLRQERPGAPVGVRCMNCAHGVAGWLILGQFVRIFDSQRFAFQPVQFFPSKGRA